MRVAEHRRVARVKRERRRMMRASAAVAGIRSHRSAMLGTEGRQLTSEAVDLNCSSVSVDVPRLSLTFVDIRQLPAPVLARDGVQQRSEVEDDE